jgi:hypothetical protein
MPVADRDDLEIYTSFIPPVQDEYLLADKFGYAIQKSGKEIFFRNRGTLPYRHLAWFSGVSSGIFALFVILHIYMLATGQGKNDGDIQLMIGLGLLFFAGIPFVHFLNKFLALRKMKPGNSPIKFKADLSRGVLTNPKGKVLCSFTDMKILKLSAWDNYFSGDEYFEKVIFRWGFRRTAVVFKTDSDVFAEELIDRLKLELLGA